MGDAPDTSGDGRRALDHDDDGVLDLVDNCPDQANHSQSDGDQDGIGDGCDNCPATANHGQADADGDGTGDACELDRSDGAPTRDGGPSPEPLDFGFEGADAGFEGPDAGFEGLDAGLEGPDAHAPDPEPDDLRFGSLQDIGDEVLELFADESVSVNGRFEDWEDAVHEMVLERDAQILARPSCPNTDLDFLLSVWRDRRWQQVYYESDHYRFDGYRLSECPASRWLGLPPGRYRFKIGSDGVDDGGEGDYRLNVVARSLTIPFVPDRRYADDQQIQMPAIPANESAVVRLAGGERVTVETGNGYRIDRGCPGDTVVEIRDDAGEVVVAADDGGFQVCSKVVEYLPRGDYTVHISGFRGREIPPYVLSLRFGVSR